MSLWIDILNATGAGDDGTATRLLEFSLLGFMRYPRSVTEPNGCLYDGPVAKAVLNYVRGLHGTPEHSLAISRSEDLIDFVADEIVAKIRRTASLVRYSRRNPEASIEGIATNFTGWDGLKLGMENRKQWVAHHLHSMSAIGVQLPNDSVAIMESLGMNFDHVFGFDERALVKGWKIGMSWQAYRKQEELSSEYLCVESSDADESAASEAFDYGIIHEARLPSLSSELSVDKAFEIQDVALRITGELRKLLEEFHLRKSSDGFRPIAWHNVWWNLTDYWNALPLKLDLKDPCCDADDLLATHISQNYLDVQKVNRLNMQRRRTKLKESSSDCIMNELSEWSKGIGTKNHDA